MGNKKTKLLISQYEEKTIKNFKPFPITLTIFNKGKFLKISHMMKMDFFRVSKVQKILREYMYKND